MVEMALSKGFNQAKGAALEALSGSSATKVN